MGVDVTKGYITDQFKESFSRYLTLSPELSVTELQVNDIDKLDVTDAIPHVVTRNGNSNMKVTYKPASSAVCNLVTDKTPETGATKNIKKTGPEAWISETGELMIRGPCNDLAATIVKLSAGNLPLQRELLIRHCQAYDKDRIADLWEAWEERAAIMEFDGGLPRSEAEYQAAKRLHLLAFMDGRNYGRS